MAQPHYIHTRQRHAALIEHPSFHPSKNWSSQFNRRIAPKTEQMLRLCLRSLGGFALTVCLLFWLHLLFA